MKQNNWFDPFFILENLSAEEKLIQKNVRDFSNNVLRPIVVNDNRNHNFDRGLYSEFGRLGLLGSTVKNHGGAGASSAAYGLIAYEIEKIDSSYRSSISVQSSLVIHPINSFGSESQKDKYLPDLISGKKIGCFGLTESEAGSDPSSMKTTYKEIQNGYILNGSKNWITNAPVADVFIIWALNDKLETDSIKGFILDKDTKGLSTSTIENKTSLKISPTGQIIIDEAYIDKSNCLENTKGWSSVFSCLNKARFGISWGVLGAASECWLIAKDYVENRIMFKKPLAANQLIQKKLADIQTEINLGLAVCNLTAKAMDENKDIINALSIIKRNNCKKSLEIVRDCRDMLGANGLIEDYHIMRHLVNLETVKTYEGAENIHSLVLGKNQTGLSSF
ncbi:acyl-CoA dehydrogenase family protein [Pelagibacteraceae bacterium]|jgi:glutaryl-CoA dehydrogenase|nr:acyl-CoA dehydrogenase family protein [Pelagibacteraceae bacterium]